MEDKKVSFTTSWPESLKLFIQGPLKTKALINPALLTQIATEQWLKDNGHWEDYQNFIVERIIA